MDKLSLFKDMHFQSELLFLPNAWDVVSAMVLEQAGFKAIGTTSYGVARAMGYEDGQRIEFDDLLGLVKKMISIIEVPITVDMEAGYSNNIITVSDNVMKIADLGASGINNGTFGNLWLNRSGHQHPESAQSCWYCHWQKPHCFSYSVP
jgi:2-methylisocitrate lyase-like PEP mutase family enzyme